MSFYIHNVYIFISIFLDCKMSVYSDIFNMPLSTAWINSFYFFNLFRVKYAVMFLLPGRISWKWHFLERRYTNYFSNLLKRLLKIEYNLFIYLLILTLNKLKVCHNFFFHQKTLEIKLIWINCYPLKNISYWNTIVL